MGNDSASPSNNNSSSIDVQQQQQQWKSIGVERTGAALRWRARQE